MPSTLLEEVQRTELVNRFFLFLLVCRPLVCQRKGLRVALCVYGDQTPVYVLCVL